MVHSATDPKLDELKRWDATKAMALRPDFLTADALREGDQSARCSFLVGAEALGLVGGRKTLQPQQFLVADLLGLSRRFTTVLMPRRSSKTTIILAWLVGRCMEEDDLLTAYGVMTSMKKARARFLSDIVKPLERRWPDRHNRPFKILKGNGAERVVFENGSELWVYGPNPDDFRSDAFDVIVLDESGEIDGDEAADIKGAALPTQDTRPGAMLVYAGTAGDSQRGNMLWDALSAAQSDDQRSVGIAYWADQNTLPEEAEAWEPSEEHPAAHARELVEAHHPGIGTLTTLDSIKDSFDAMGASQFLREYLGVFADPRGTATLIGAERWSHAKQDGDLPELPERFGLAMALHPDQTCASLVAAWRDGEGRACVMVVDARKGVKWIAERALGLSRKYGPRIVGGIAYDTQGPAMVEVEFMQRQAQRPRMAPNTWPDIRTASALIVKEIAIGNLAHWGQPDLDDAVACVVKRLSGPQNWALGRRERSDDITPMEAAAMALVTYDKSPKRSFGSLVA